MITICLIFSLPLMLVFFSIQYLCNIDLTEDTLDIHDYEQELGNTIPVIPTQQIYQGNNWITVVVLN